MFCRQYTIELEKPDDEIYLRPLGGYSYWKSWM